VGVSGVLGHGAQHGRKPRNTLICHWWAEQGSNLRPRPCKGDHCPCAGAGLALRPLFISTMSTLNERHVPPGIPTCRIEKEHRPEHGGRRGLRRFRCELPHELDGLEEQVGGAIAARQLDGAATAAAMPDTVCAGYAQLAHARTETIGRRGPTSSARRRGRLGGRCRPPSGDRSASCRRGGRSTSRTAR
jgi:hypothetical protein